MYKFAKKVANHEGFTLVELIVVIAILGILAGIAIPVYSGYIKKANEAADNTLLAAVNTAFAAACVENGVSVNDIADGGAVLTISSGKINPSTLNVTTAAALPAGYSETKLQASFDAFFGTNKETKFKAFTELEYSQERGFYGKGSGIAGNAEPKLISSSATTITRDGETLAATAYTFDIDGNEVTYTIADVDKEQFGASTFGNGSITFSEMMGDVSTVVKAAESVWSSDNVSGRIIDIVGNDFLKEIGLADENGVLKEEVTSDQLSNALVLFVAKNTNAQTKNNVMSGNYTIDTNNMGATLSDVSAMLGLVTGYANSDIGKTTTVGDGTTTVKEYFDQQMQALKNSVSGGGGSAGLQAVVDMVNGITLDDKGDATEGFASYAMSGQAEKDLDGYISAMFAVKDNSGTVVNNSGVLTNGFTDNSFVSILNSIFN